MLYPRISFPYIPLPLLRFPALLSSISILSGPVRSSLSLHSFPLLPYSLSRFSELDKFQPLKPLPAPVHYSRPLFLLPCLFWCLFSEYHHLVTNVIVSSNFQPLTVKPLKVNPWCRTNFPCTVCKCYLLSSPLPSSLLTHHE